MSTNIVGMVVAMNKRPVQESQYNCTLSWLLDVISLNDTEGGTGTLQKRTAKIPSISFINLFASSINAVRDAAVRKCERSARA